MLEVSASACYTWRGNPASWRVREDRRLLVGIKAIGLPKRGACAGSRMHAEFTAQGLGLREKRVPRKLIGCGPAMMCLCAHVQRPGVFLPGRSLPRTRVMDHLALGSLVALSRCKTAGLAPGSIAGKVLPMVRYQ